MMLQKIQKSPVSLLVGTIVGVGIFGLPYVASQTGFWLAVVYLIALAVVSGATLLVYAKIILATKGEHRFIGYTRIYLGGAWSNIVTATHTIGLFGAQLAYLSVGGVFLAKLLSFPPAYGVTGFFIFGTLFLYLDLKGVNLGELLMTEIMYLIVALFLILGIPHIKLSNLSPVNFNFNNFFLPYGIMLFALWGQSVIPEVIDLAGRNYKKTAKAIFGSMVIVIAIYLLFIISVLGLSGLNTSQDAISGLTKALPRYAVFLGSLFGFLATITSFLGIGLTLKKTLLYDAGIKKYTWLWPTVVPLIGFALGLSNYLKVISIVGAVFLGFEAIVTYLIYFKAGKAELERKKFIKALAAFLILILAAGVALGIKRDIKNFKTMPKTSTNDTKIQPEEEELTLIASDKWKLAGTYYAAENPKAGIILAHMYGRTKADFRDLIPKLLKAGISAVAYDARGHGASQGNYAQFTVKDFQDMINDINVAHEFMKSKLGKKPVYLLGASIGANNVLRYASLDPSIKKVVLLSPGLDYRGLYAKEFLPKLKAKVLLAASEEDSYSFTSSQKIWDELPTQKQSRFIKLDGNKHGTGMLDEIGDRVIKFLED